MRLPSVVLATRDRYVAAFPLWSMSPGAAAEDRARKWAIGLVSQIVLEHGETYGSKRADPTRPISKDALAQQQGAQLLGWDMLTGAGSGAPKLVANPNSMDITGQTFVHIEGRNIIAGADIPNVGDGDSGGNGDSPKIPYNESYSVEFGKGCNDIIYNEMATPKMELGMISVQSQRAAWDYYVGGMSWPASRDKHWNEFRAVYGLPPK